MKKLSLVFTLAFALLTVKSHGQNNIECGIYFDYDAVGNRIKRSYDCRSNGPVVIQLPPGSTSKMAPVENAMSTLESQTTVLVYPNPTSGAFTIRLSEMPKNPIHFHWYNDQLQILGSGSITETTYSGDISGWADGVYLLQVYEGKKVHAFKVVKVSSAGR